MNSNISFSALALSEDGLKLFGYDNFKISIYDTRSLSLLKSIPVQEVRIKRIYISKGI